MNLSYVHKLLLAADQQGHDPFPIRGRRADREVRLMIKAGLVDATLSNGKDESFTTINCLTDLGRTFLRAFTGSPKPARLPPPRTRTAAEWQSDSRSAVIKKWNVNFALDLQRPKQAD